MDTTECGHEYEFDREEFTQKYEEQHGEVPSPNLLTVLEGFNYALLEAYRQGASGEKYDPNKLLFFF